MKPTIINVGGEARHGKGSTCNYIEKKIKTINKKCLQINYGDYVKFCYAMYKKGSVDIMFERTKENRTGWQLFGTEEVRSEDDDFWVNTVIRLIEVVGKNYDYILISDFRFPNETYRWIEEDYKVVTIHVKRLKFNNGLTAKQKLHKSENALKDFQYNYYLKATDLQELGHQIDEKLDFLFK